jgi:hypothetical protein
MATVISRELGLDVDRYDFRYGFPKDIPPEKRSTSLFIDMYPMRYLYDEKQELVEIYPGRKSTKIVTYNPLQLQYARKPMPKTLGPDGVASWTVESAGPESPRSISTEHFIVKPGTQIQAKAITYVEQLTDSYINLMLYFYDENGNRVLGTGNSITEEETVWTGHTVSAEVPTGATDAVVTIFWMPLEGKQPKGVLHCSTLQFSAE